MRSMTGFGVGAAPLGGGRVLCEVRSLNHRYLDVRVRTPTELSDQCFLLEQLARERLARGRFDIGVRLEGPALASAELDVERARSAYRALLGLRDELAPGTELPLGILASLPELFRSRTSVDPDQAAAALVQALDAALERLDAMRQAEGTALERELAERLATLRSLRASVAERSGELVPAYRARLRERLERLLSDTHVRIDSGRLEIELGVLADKSDITEELVRLESHFQQLAELLRSGEAVGRRVDFLLQEVSREVNTIGAKSQDAPLAHLVVEMKAEIERMREQVQNVE